MNTNNDFFADIATAHMGQSREPLVAPPRPQIPDRLLPLGTPASESRPRATGISSAKEVRAALVELRQRFSPFLRDLAPALPLDRQRMAFKSFDWRVETAGDRRNFEAALKGEGAWERVAIPHYGPPLGKAATLYRAEFELPAEFTRSRMIRLCFGGVDYKCQVYLNGLCLGAHEGFFEEFWLDCGGALRPGLNTLLVRVENDFTMFGDETDGVKIDGDKIYAATGLGYDEPQRGWHHCPPAMGIWNKVTLEALAPIFVDDVWVRPLLESEEIEVNVEIENHGSNPEAGIAVEVSVHGQNFEAVIHKDHVWRGAVKFVRGYGDLVHSEEAPVPALLGFGRNYVSVRLPLTNPRVWTPETPWLYQAQVVLRDATGTRLDAARVQFGMRSFTQDESSEPKGKFYLNGQELRLRGANTMGNFERCIMQGNCDQLHEDILLAKLTQMNYLRMTQRPVHREFYEACDRLGMMVQTDLPMFSNIRRNQFVEVVRQAGCMERHVRRHCSNILVSYINEPRPVAGCKPHRFLLRKEMESLFDMATRCVRQNNPDRVVKYVDGDYDPPTSAGMPDNHVYCGWYIGHGIDLGALHAGAWLPVKGGWHYGCGEFGAEGLDSYEVMAAEYPTAWKPANPDTPWSPAVIAMSQTWKFHFLWFEAGRSAREWIENSQSFQAWVIGLMTAAYRRMPGMNSFAVHLFIDAWPGGWMKSLMDVHRTPKQAWFAYRDALTPTAVFLRTDRTQLRSGEAIGVEVWVCNDRPEPLDGWKLCYDVSAGGQRLANGAETVSVPACAPQCQGLLPIDAPKVDERTMLQVGITLLDPEGNAVHEHTLDFDLFPETSPIGTRIWCPDATPELERFVARLGGVRVGSIEDGPEAILFSAPAMLDKYSRQIQTAVERGAIALALNLPCGEYRLGHASVKVREASMGLRHFVSRNTGHPLVEGFRPNDFRFWYRETLGRVGPILGTFLEAPGWSPVLMTGDGGWSRPWAAYPAVAEKKEGLGCWRVAQVELLDCIEHNPAAKLFAGRLLKGAPSK